MYITGGCNIVMVHAVGDYAPSTLSENTLPGPENCLQQVAARQWLKTAQLVVGTVGILGTMVVMVEQLLFHLVMDNYYQHIPIVVIWKIF